MEGAVPGRVTEMPAMALANCVASIKSIPPLGATACRGDGLVGAIAVCHSSRYFRYDGLLIVGAWRGDSIGGMPVDAKLQAILDAGKALGRKPVELQTPAEARAER